MSEEELAKKCAYILGPSSAAAQALDKLEQHRAKGDEAEILYDRARRMWLVLAAPDGGSSSEKRKT